MGEAKDCCRSRTDCQELVACGGTHLEERLRPNRQPQRPTNVTARTAEPAGPSLRFPPPPLLLFSLSVGKCVWAVAICTRSQTGREGGWIDSGLGQLRQSYRHACIRFVRTGSVGLTRPSIREPHLRAGPYPNPGGRGGADKGFRSVRADQAHLIKPKERESEGGKMMKFNDLVDFAIATATYHGWDPLLCRTSCTHMLIQPNHPSPSSPHHGSFALILSFETHTHTQHEYPGPQQGCSTPPPPPRPGTHDDSVRSATSYVALTTDLGRGWMGSVQGGYHATVGTSRPLPSLSFTCKCECLSLQRQPRAGRAAGCVAPSDHQASLWARDLDNHGDGKLLGKDITARLCRPGWGGWGWGEVSQWSLPTNLPLSCCKGHSILRLSSRVGVYVCLRHAQSRFAGGT